MCRLIAIIISVFKWLGIILLAVLGVVLTILACLLFVPVRYHVRIEHQQEWQIRGRASWLLHLLHFSLEIQGGQERHTLRIAGIPCNMGERKEKWKKKKRSSKKESKRTGKTEKSLTEKSKQADKPEQSLTEKNKQTGKPVKSLTEKSKQADRPEQSLTEKNKQTGKPVKSLTEKSKQADKPEQMPTEKSSPEAGAKQPEEIQTGQDTRVIVAENQQVQEIEVSQGEDKDTVSGKGMRGTGRRLFTKIQNGGRRLREFFLHIQHILGKIYKCMKGIWKFLWEGPPERTKSSRLSGVKEILLDSNTSALWRLVWENLIRLWRHSRPRKLKGRIRFGTSDPCTTGQILGAIGAGYSLIGSGVQITPDFEEQVLEGNLEIKGRIQIFVLLLVLKRVLLSQEWKQFKKQTDRMKEGS